MRYGVCAVGVSSVRVRTSHKSELLSQLLFGECLEILERKGRQWARVRCAWDDFVGWVATNEIMEITRSEFERMTASPSSSLEYSQALRAPDHFLPIPLGASLPEFDGIRLQLGNRYYEFSGQSIQAGEKPATPQLILKLARRYLYVPYLWGGRSVYGIDSPGLIQMIFKLAGIALPREANQQVHLGESVDFIDQSQEGDLVFFENRARRINHVGILLGNGEVLHAYGRVRIDKIDHYGIYDTVERRYTHKLRVLRRLLSEEKKVKTKQPAEEVSVQQPTLF